MTWKRHLLAAVFGIAAMAHAQAVKTVVAGSPGHWQLLRGGQPYFIDGVGGSEKMDQVQLLGGNSIRTWNPDAHALDQAHQLGMTVCLGLKLESERHGFSYNNADDVSRQYENARAAIEQFKDHPALLCWGIGNEVEGLKDGDNAAVWSAIESIAHLAHQLDPNHPTVAVVAGIGGQRVQCIHRLCPDIDIVGINAYGDLPTVPERYAKLGGTKPYIVTEFGPVGWWECEKTSWGAPIEDTSQQKADVYEHGYLASIVGQPSQCFGSYAFLWGSKQETTATWFGLLLPDGTKLNAVSRLSGLWRGCHCGHQAPQIDPIKLAELPIAKPGATLHASVAAVGDEQLHYEWQLQREPDRHGEGGDYEPPTTSIANAISPADGSTVTVNLPENPGDYRLYVYVRDGAGYGATANVPLKIDN